MGRFIAIDLGLKRTGVAVTDNMKLIATPLITLATNQLNSFLSKYIETEKVERIILGMPKNLDQSDTDMSSLVRSFTRKLKHNYTKIEIVLHDERFTTKMAIDALIRGGFPKKSRQKKGSLDRVSATILLQSYIESIK